MPEAVIFDFYGTLAHWADSAASYTTVFSSFGYEPAPSVLERYFSQYDGVDHAEHSVSEDAYEAWVRWRLAELSTACGVKEEHRAAVVDGLRNLDGGPMVAYPEAAETLCSLREADIAIGVCSNWGWELDAYLDEVGLLGLVDSTITSARAGSRKPHPGIYGCSTDALGLDPTRVVFVGDSWEPDVRGPRRIGMTAVHVWRADERSGQVPPALEPGDHRVAELTGVLPIAGVVGASVS
ncbi:MAG TPA: HAD family hydrolase [Acidimicrobiales bacterium]|nr:HAD family hydrolase [Acidimicrobiales bacterium]